MFRGPTKAEDANMLVQQLGQIVPQFQDILQPEERRKALGFMLESLNVAGVASIITPQGSQSAQVVTQQQQAVAGAQGQAALTQAQAANEQVPGSIPVGQTPPVQ